MKHGHLPNDIFTQFFRVILSVSILFLLPVTTHSEENHFNKDLFEQSVSTLIHSEQTGITKPDIVRSRHAELVTIIRQLLHSSCFKIVDTIFSNDDERMIQQMYSLNQLDEASSLIHNAIYKLRDIDCVATNNADKHSDSLQTPQGQTDEKHQNPQQKQGASAPQQIESARIISSYNMHSIATGSQLSNMLKLVNSVIDSSSQRLYFTGTKSTSVGVVDLNLNTLIETFDIGHTGGFLIFDQTRNNLYLFDIRQRAYYEISLKNKTCIPIPELPSGVTMPPKEAPHFVFNNISYDTIDSYPFLAKTQQNNNGSYTIMERKDKTGKVLGQFKFGPDSLYSVLDNKTGLLYCNITGGGAIEFFDLNKNALLTGNIDVGTSIDQILLHPESGGLFIRNRLGGSTIQYFNPVTLKFKEIKNENAVGHKGIGLWPTDMIYNAGKIYVLCHFSGRIDVIDVETWKIVNSYPLTLSAKPRTHALSYMAMDTKKNILYAAFPELGEIASVNITNPKKSKTITIKEFNTSSHGAALVELAVDEKRGHLFAYMANERRMDIYDGTNLTLLNSIAVDAGRHEYMLTYRPDRDLLYVGNLVFQLSDMTNKVRFPEGDRVVGYDSTTDRVFLSSTRMTGNAQKTELLHEYHGMVLKKDIILPPIIDIPSSFAFPKNAESFFAGGFDSAIINKIGLK